jgi:hypothetical protein
VIFFWCRSEGGLVLLGNLVKDVAGNQTLMNFPNKDTTHIFTYQRSILLMLTKMN